ncbi:uncharacterized protein LOC110024332, partial [Phalaenopsis equestris]|uniref:uncharacterized protein LOC110024332 n=1 Tax=Phalaenopsis equestris TaxID=78828 RepID=UPI0009E53FBE
MTKQMTVQNDTVWDATKDEGSASSIRVCIRSLRNSTTARTMEQRASLHPKPTEQYHGEDNGVKPDVHAGKKVIGLDDLLTDFYTKQSQIDGNACKKSKASERCSSDDEDDPNERGNETKFSEIANECEKQMNQITAEKEIPLWGQEIFGQQKSLPLLSFIELENCKLFQPFRKNELDSDLLLDSEQGAGEKFLEGFLINGWLTQLSFISGYVEASVASWTFYQALYSSNEKLQLSACEFWCSILLSKTEASEPSVVLEWIPRYHELKKALEVYGYLSDASENVALNSISSSR